MKVAVAGYGNIGKAVIDTLNTTSDLEFVGLIRRDASNVPDGLDASMVVENVSDLKVQPDTIILTQPSRTVPESTAHYLSLGYNTVDSFDIHTEIISLLSRTQDIAAKHETVAVHAAGWDPGSDSIIRALMLAMAPRGLTYTNFGPGMSMGHSVAAKAIPGVADALSMTIPLGTSVHRRMVYVELEEGANFQTVKDAILTDAYFASDETHVIEVANVKAVMDTGHGVHMVRKGVSGISNNQHFEFNMSINNPALTAAVLVASARATGRQLPGAYTLIDIPVIDLLEGEREDLISKLV